MTSTRTLMLDSSSRCPHLSLIPGLLQMEPPPTRPNAQVAMARRVRAKSVLR
jgi:hypothetical protein